MHVRLILDNKLCGEAEESILLWATRGRPAGQVEKLHRFVTASEYVGYEWSVEEGDEEMRKHKDKLEELKKEETEAAEQQKACEDRINEIIRSRQDESSKQLEKLQSLENTVPHTFTDNL